MYRNDFRYSEESNQWPDCSIGRKMARPVQFHYYTRVSSSVALIRKFDPINIFFSCSLAFLSTSSANWLLIIVFLRYHPYVGMALGTYWTRWSQYASVIIKDGSTCYVQLSEMSVPHGTNYTAEWKQSSLLDTLNEHSKLLLALRVGGQQTHK